MKEPKVAVLRTKPESVVADYGKLMDLAEYKRHISSKFETILKLNLSWSLYYPACSTEPWQLEGVVKKMQEDKFSIIPVENRTVVTNPMKGAQLNKWMPVLQRYGLKFQPLTQVEWVGYKPKHEMLAIESLFPDGLKIPKMFIGRNVVHLPTMKTHGHTVVTGAVKNAFGGLITKRRHHSHKVIDEVLTDLLQIQKEIHPGIFAVMDGTVAGDGAGPRTMMPKIKNIILASGDQVAIDAISAKMMGFDPMKIKFIKLCHDHGLGIGDPRQIDVVGMDIKGVNWHFQTKKSPVVYWDQVFRKRHPSMEKLLFHTPLFNLCIAGSAVYHDYVWYPIAGKPAIRKFMKTEWGKLFSEY